MCLRVFTRIFVNILVHIFSVGFVAVESHHKMLDYQECEGNDCEDGGVGIRWPQDDVYAMHILQKCPPVRRAHFLIVAHLQKATGGGYSCRTVPVTLDEDMAQSVRASWVHFVLDDGLNAAVTQGTCPWLCTVFVLLDHEGVVWSKIGLL